MPKVEGHANFVTFSFPAILTKVQDNSSTVIDEWFKWDAKPQVQSHKYTLPNYYTLIDMFNDKLFHLISLINCDGIPLTIFTRALVSLPEWNAEGELVERPPSRSMVPMWFQQVFQAADFPDGLELHNRISSVFHPPCILLQSSVADTCISIGVNAREAIRSSIPDAIQTKVLFEILSLMIHGFPVQEAEIDYRMEKQYLPVFESTCLPFLLKINFDDILHYCSGSNGNSSSPSAQTDFLLSAWSFLRRVERSRLKVLPSGVYHLELQIGNYLSLKKAEIDVFNLQYLKTSRSITNTLLSSSSEWYIDNIKQHRNYNQPRINAIIGSTILEVSKHALDIENPWNPTIWMPLKNDHWSSYERLVFAIARREYSPSTSLKLSVLTEVLVAFKMAHYGQFAVAQEILLRCVPKIQKEHGSFSAEFIISGTELVLCCNSLLHPELGAQWAERIYAHASPFLEFQYPSLEINLRMAKIDAEIGQGKYKIAMEKLQSLLALENLPSSVVLRASLRLLKSHRRQNDALPNPDIWSIYGKALNHAHLVSSLLFHEFLIEALSIFSLVKNQARSQIRRSQVSCIIQARVMLIDTIILTESMKGRLIEDIPETVLQYYTHAMRNYAVILEPPSLKGFLASMKGMHSTEEDYEAELWDRMSQQEPLFSPGFEKLAEKTRDTYRDHFKTMKRPEHLVPYVSDSEKELGNKVEYQRQKSFIKLVGLPEKPVVGQARRSRSHATNTRGQPTTDSLKKDDIDYKLHQENEVLTLKTIYEEDIKPIKTFQSVGVTLEDHPDRASHLNNLGAHFDQRYKTEAVQASKLVVDADFCRWLNDLGLLLSNRYVKTGKMADLEEAIYVSKRAIDVTPEDHPYLSRWLSNLGLRLSNRYEKTGVMADLEEAIQVSKRAIDATSEDDSYLAGRLNNLGAYLGQRYRRSGVMTDLEEAIYVSQRAVDATSEVHQYYAGRLNNLEAHLDQRYRKLKAISDLDERSLVTQYT